MIRKFIIEIKLNIQRQLRGPPVVGKCELKKNMAEALDLSTLLSTEENVTEGT